MTEIGNRQDRRRFPTRLIGEAVIAVLVVVFLLQNSETTKVEFLVVTATVSVWLVILISMALGALVTVLANARRQRRRATKTQRNG